MEEGGTDPVPRLVEAAREGDEGAFRRLVAHIREPAYRWALARTGEPDLAEDVLQEVLLRLHRHLDGYRGEAAFEAWLYRITANAAASALSHRSRRHQAEGEATAGRTREGPPEGERRDDPLARIYAGRITGLVHTYFHELPDRQREVFDLADLQGHAPAEIAEMLEMNPATVRANLFKARRAIRTRVLEDHPELEEGWSG